MDVGGWQRNNCGNSSVVGAYIDIYYREERAADKFCTAHPSHQNHNFLAPNLQFWVVWSWGPSTWRSCRPVVMRCNARTKRSRGFSTWSPFIWPRIPRALKGAVHMVFFLRDIVGCRENLPLIWRGALAHFYGMHYQVPSSRRPSQARTFLSSTVVYISPGFG